MWRFSLGGPSYAVLVHSKSQDFGELREFAAKWDLAVPLVAVPTTYPDVSMEELGGGRAHVFC